MDVKINEITVKIEVIEEETEDEEEEDPLAFDYKGDVINEAPNPYGYSGYGSNSTNHGEALSGETADHHEGREGTNVEEKPDIKLEHPIKEEDDSKNNGVYCSTCNKRFKSKGNLRQHIKHIHSDDYFVECNKCDRTFKSYAHLKSHADCAHPKPGTEAECDECGKVFINKKKLSNHKYYTHAAPEEKVSCITCKKTFMKQYKLNVHMRQVHVLDRTASCDICRKVFKNEMLLGRHVKWSHPTDQTEHKCDDCGKQFPSWRHYKKHKDNAHATSEGLQCELCDRVLANKKSLNRHLVTHSKGKIFKPRKGGKLPCTICDKKFPTNTSLYWHIEMDHSENYHLKKSCHICTKEFTDHHVLRRHLEAVHPLETATCTICNKTFKSAINVESHMRTTHAPPEAARTCDICQKTFKCSMHLRIHINAVHPPDGGVVCDICNRPFVSKRYLYAHKKNHVKKREFHCKVCGKSFKRQVDVGKHTKKVHNKPDPPVSRCLNCEKCFTSDNELHEHLVSCTGGGAEKLLPVIKIEVSESEE